MESIPPPEGVLGDTSCEDDVEALTSLAETPVWGYFINPVGETWRWRPRDPVATYMAIRRSNREEFIELAVEETVPKVRGADETRQGEDGGDGGEDAFRSAGILGPDNRLLRSEVNGNSMTSINQSWIRMGGLPSDTWDPQLGIDNTMGTATKIGPRHLLTAGHNVWAGGVFFPKDWWAGEDGVANDTGLAGTDAPNGNKNIDWYFVAPGWYEDGENYHDYAVLMLYDNASSAQFPSFGFKEDYALAGQSVWNFGIPWPNNSCSASPFDSNECRSSQYGHLKPVRRTEASYVFTAHDVQEGHSGGPVYVWDNGKRNIVAIVKSSYTSQENRHLKIQSRVFDTLLAVMNARPSSYCTDYGWAGTGCK